MNLRANREQATIKKYLIVQYEAIRSDATSYSHLKLQRYSVVKNYLTTAAISESE